MKARELTEEEEDEEMILIPPASHLQQLSAKGTRLGVVRGGCLMKFLLAACAALGICFVTGGSNVLAASPETVCTGELSPGSYGKVVVPDDAVCLSDGPVTIHGGLKIGQGATFVLGSDDNPGDTGTISGGVQATNPASVQIHSTTINGGIDIQGGSGPFGGPFEVTWNAIEDNSIHGAVNINGYNGFWFGFIRNSVSGSVTLSNNVIAEDDGNEFVTNTIKGNLNCFGNSPAPQVGDSEGEPNVVSGRKTGQCSSLS